MHNILEEIYNMTFGLIIEFIGNINFIYGSGNQLDEIPFRLGLGSIEFYNGNLYELFTLIGSLIIGIIFILLIWKVFKFFTKLVNRAFGGRKW